MLRKTYRKQVGVRLPWKFSPLFTWLKSGGLPCRFIFLCYIIVKSPVTSDAAQPSQAKPSRAHPASLPAMSRLGILGKYRDFRYLLKPKFIKGSLKLDKKCQLGIRTCCKSIVNKQGYFSSGVLRRLARFLYLLEPVITEESTPHHSELIHFDHHKTKTNLLFEI